MKKILFLALVLLLIHALGYAQPPVIATGGTVAPKSEIAVPFSEASQKRFNAIGVQIMNLKDSVWLKGQIAKLEELQNSILLTTVEAKGHDPNKVQLVGIKPGEILIKPIEEQKK